MNFPLINVNTYHSVSDKIRLCFWVYLLLLIFEGAMRKWFLPQLSNLFLVVRDPILLYVIYINFKYKICSDIIVKVLFIFSFISFVLTLLFGHQNILVALYGVRVTMLHLPSIFIFGKVITKGDIHLIGKTVLYISVLMFVIIILQYFSPQTSWINIGTGGAGTASFSGVAGYMRPSGTFSFITGLVEFEFLVGLYLFYYMYNNSEISIVYNFKKVTLLIFIAVFLFSFVLCLSRTLVFEILFMFTGFVAYMIFRSEKLEKIIYIGILIIIFFSILYNINSFKLALDNIFLRFETASTSEGDIIGGSLGNRYLGSFYRAFFDTQNNTNQEIPFLGFGLGIGTKVGEQILGIHTAGHTFAFAEEEWSRIVCEVGLLQGIVFLLGFRLICPIYLVYNALKYINKKKDIFLYLSIFPFVIYIINAQWCVPTTLGFTVVFGTLFIASLNQNKFHEI